MTVHVLYPDLWVRVCASQGSLDMQDFPIQIYTDYVIDYYLKVYGLRHFSTDDIITYLNIYLRLLTYFLPFQGFLFVNHQSLIIHISYWDVRGRKNFHMC